MPVVKSRFDRKTKSFPITSALGEKKGHGYLIEEDNEKARTNCKTKEMFVPLDVEICPECNVSHSTAIRAHELGHAKWSPKNVGKKENPYGASFMMYEGCEEVRVNYLIRRAGVKTNKSLCDHQIKDFVVNFVAEKNKRKKAFLLLAISETDDFEVFDKLFTKMTNPIKRTWDREGSMDVCDTEFGVDFFEKHEELIRQTQEVYAIVENGVRQLCYTKRLRPRQNVWSKSVSEIAKYLDEALEEPELPADLDTLPDEMQNFIKENIEAEAEKLKAVPRYSEGKSQWGTMTKLTAPMVQNLGGVLKARKSRPQDMGAVPKYMHRYATDQKIFYKSRRVLGGTVLVDVSGSMGLRADEIMEILGYLPAATIAMYSGAGSVGNLVIVAENGKMTNQKYIDSYRMYGNIIDGPALDWLGKQPGPRVWVSDGQATGRGDSFVEALRLECINKQIRHGIIRLDDTEAVIEFSKKYKKEA